MLSLNLLQDLLARDDFVELSVDLGVLVFIENACHSGKLVVDHENIGVISVASGQLTLLTDYDDSTSVVDYPSWSADGRLIHYSLARRRGDIYLMAPDTDSASASE